MELFSYILFQSVHCWCIERLLIFGSWFCILLICWSCLWCLGVFFYNEILFSLHFYCIFIRIYSLYREGFVVTILIRLILHIIYIASIISRPQLPPHPARVFFSQFHIDIWSPSTIYHYLNLISSPSPLPLVPPHTHMLCLFYSRDFHY
jgi:hypothetical protein